MEARKRRRLSRENVVEGRKAFLSQRAQKWISDGGKPPIMIN